MRARPEAGHLATVAYGLIIAALIVVLLIVGREILEPLVIAALLAFILSPLIRRLRQWGVWRVPSVVLTVLFALGLIAGLSAIIGLQVTQLAQDLPTYETNLRNKIRTLGAGKLTSGALDRASGTLRDLQEEITKAGPATPAGQKPMVVEVRQPEPRGLESIATLVRPLLSPLAMTALVVLFLIFILLQREDIRDRFLRLAGTADLQRSTAALDDAGSRLSRFFLMQTLLNAGFGIFIAIGLWIIGVPNAVLWGIFAGLMRFVPFIGSLIAAFFPIALAAAVDPGWTMALAVAVTDAYFFAAVLEKALVVVNATAGVAMLDLFYSAIGKIINAASYHFIEINHRIALENFSCCGVIPLYELELSFILKIYFSIYFSVLI